MISHTPIMINNVHDRQFEQLTYVTEKLEGVGPTALGHDNYIMVIMIDFSYKTNHCIRFTIWFDGKHYGDVVMGAIASQSISFTIVYSTIYSDVDQRKQPSSALLAFVRGIHRGPLNSPYKWSVTRKMFPFDDVTMISHKIGDICNHLNLCIGTIMLAHMTKFLICCGSRSQWI